MDDPAIWNWSALSYAFGYEAEDCNAMEVLCGARGVAVAANGGAANARATSAGALSHY